MVDQAPLRQLRQIRLEKLKAMTDQKVDPYPAKATRSQSITQALKSLDLETAVVGRIMAWRGHGKIQFADLKDQTGKMQIVFKADVLNDRQFKLLEKFDIGDFLAAQGQVFKTSSGEISVLANNFQLLSKSLRPLPSKWYGLKDKEERFRKRYLDLLMNSEAKQILDVRWQIERAIREFLWQEQYIEVETPVLQNLYGGTNARPFTTHINSLDRDMYLRIAPELYLKRLIIGGYERIFEIARNFRNEGMDQAHQPEFTMMEFYEAYADYHRIMDLTEGLVKYAAKVVNGNYKLKVGEHKVDLGGKWRRITIDEAVKEHLGIDWESVSEEEIRELLSKHKFQVPGVFTREKALFIIYDHLVTRKLIQPTWVIDYPLDVSPLSRNHRSKKGRAERFEGYIGGREICDGWSEVVSELEQRRRFEVEQKNMKAGDDEAQPLDEEFLEALSFGCPPLGGIGIGIDRLVMFLTNTWSIREVIAFPLMKPKE
ncbi:lysine--tRNA ligase [Candidatus Beckwithbacteria bacterium RBG_13_42_9]|uniref:Lysine--tRNA ligase n=1 Tax=Candidatus Beckwithbacteria bacterium RBG_13_42_9 TaxID=1797457 RepID=A0A1F5E8H8_9BACT|nr:MAG: lysine--tRNA ligase [Candidatus Beckwithbacteria bacterium RBG_13_42_9]